MDLTRFLVLKARKTGCLLSREISTRNVACRGLYNYWHFTCTRRIPVPFTEVPSSVQWQNRENKRLPTWAQHWLNCTTGGTKFPSYTLTLPCQGGSQAETAWRSRYHRTGHGPDIMGITTCHCRQAERWHTTVCKRVQAQRSSLPYTAPIPNNRRNPPRPKRLQLYFPKLILRNAITKLNLPNRLVNWQHSEHTLASAVTSVCHIEHQYALKYANT